MVSRNHQTAVTTTRCYSTATNTTTTNPTSSAQKDKKESNDQETEPSKKSQPLILSARDKLNLVVKDYGKTAIVFHVGISLISLGGFYALVSRYEFFIYFYLVLNLKLLKNNRV